MWSPAPDAVTTSETPLVGVDVPLSAGDRGAEVIAVGAYCTLAASDDPSSAQSFAIAEYLEVATGTLVALHSERGFTIGAGNAGDLRTSLTRADVADTALDAVLPDGEDVGEVHPYEWLAELARGRGFSMSGDDLRELPYFVVLGDDVEAWLPPEDA